MDFEIEQFWLGFKNSMINFYKSKSVNRPINEWSNYLNNLQFNKKYELIEHCITKYISLYAIDLMRANDYYSINILNTNSPKVGIKSVKNKIFDDTKSRLIKGVI